MYVCFRQVPLFALFFEFVLAFSIKICYYLTDM